MQQQSHTIVKRILQCVAVLSVVACAGETAEWQAATQARQYYESLAEGDAVRFLEGKAGIEHQPADYGEQLLKAVEQYRDERERKHGGIRSVRISDNTLQGAVQKGRGKDCDCRQADGTVKAFLILCYGDSTQEEILVPMVEVKDGEWRMK